MGFILLCLNHKENNLNFPILNAQAALLNILISFPFFPLLLPFILNTSAVIWENFARCFRNVTSSDPCPRLCPPSSAVAVITPERSPRPTSAPAIAQSHAAEPGPAKPGSKDVVAASKIEKEAAKPDVRREEIPLEKAKPEPADASKVHQTCVSLEAAGDSVLETSREHQLCAPSLGEGSIPRQAWDRGEERGFGAEGHPSLAPWGAGQRVLVAAVKLNATSP